jgi:hypothetical protein
MPQLHARGRFASRVSNHVIESESCRVSHHLPMLYRLLRTHSGVMPTGRNYHTNMVWLALYLIEL